MEEMKYTLDHSTVLPPDLGLEKALRQQNANDSCKFGIAYFDDALRGIYPNDLVLIGAKSGAGKTQLATHIAMTNAQAGKKVLYFALEAENQEIARRIKYSRVANAFFKHRDTFPGLRMDYASWYYCKYGNKLDQIEKKVDDELKTTFANIKTFYRTHGRFTIDDFEKYYLAEVNQADITIIDHIHYFDSDEQNENKALKEITMRLRDQALLNSKPLIVIAHLRKRDKRAKMLIPDLEEFHGTSDLGKIATKAIAIAPAYDVAGPSAELFPTYLRVLKSRVNSSIERYTALGYFDISRNEYQDHYKLGVVDDNKGEWNEVESTKVPYWSKREITKSVPSGAITSHRIYSDDGTPTRV